MPAPAAEFFGVSLAMQRQLYVTWQDPVTRSWYPVGKLAFEDGEYTFVYTHGALASERFLAFGSMSDLHAKYYSKKLFALFANRILSESRSDYNQYLSWMNLSGGEERPLETLARTGGSRATDSLQIYACPNKNPDGKYESYFFCHGIRSMFETTSNFVLTLKPGDIVYPMLDILNRHDENAVALRTADPTMMIGYVPRYLAPDVAQLAVSSAGSFEARIERVNAEAPIQYRLLCRLTANWPEKFMACSDRTFEPLYNSGEEPQRQIVVSS
jgi:hypothetical protein